MSAPTLSRTTTTLQSTLEISTDFILRQYSKHTATVTGSPSPKALVIGIQGPQGSGKSYLAEQLERSSKLKHLKIANLSLDDLYLPHDELVRLATENRGNRLLSGRGQAGTHDLPLGVRVLEQLRRERRVVDPNEDEDEEVREGGRDVVKVPRFEKSLYDGEGDRLEESEWTQIKGQVDVVLFEGWMLGFKSIPSRNDLEKVYNLTKRAQEGGGGGEPERAKVRELLGGIDYEEPFISQFELEHLERLNEELKGYEQMWELVDGWIELKPEKLGYVWEWRLEQEHTMKAKNGGIGMTDEQVKTFISRYMPGYELFSTTSRIPKGDDSRKHGPLLTVEIGKQRQVLHVDETLC